MGFAATPYAPAVLAKVLQNETNKSQMVTSAKITTAKAVQAATTRIGGNNLPAHIMKVGEEAIFRVEVVIGDTQQDYDVDATTGAITKC